MKSKMAKTISTLSSSLLLPTIIVAVVWESAYSQQGVRLTLRGVQYHDNGIIDITDVGENDAALICQTDLRPCCRDILFRAGQWYYPNGTAVPISIAGGDFYRNRGDDGTVRLNRRNNAIYPIGIYRCEIPDQKGINQSLYIGLLTYSHFGDSIVDLFYGSNNSTLTCITTGAPATSVYGECINNDCLRLPVKITVDPERQLYNTMLNVSQKTSSYYVCTTKRADRTSYATLLTKSGRGDRMHIMSSSQIVGRAGEQLTMLCLADEQIHQAAWTGGTTNNITFTHLSSINAGVYTCSGTTINNGIVSHSVNLVVSECGAVVWITSNMETRVIFGRDHSLTCNTQLRGTGCTIDAYFIYHDGQPKLTNNTIRFTPLKLSDADYYLCTVTVNGHNFTSHPTFVPLYTQIPAPEVIMISSSLENPVPLGSTPTLTCIIRLNPTVDNEFKITVTWSGPAFGFGKFITTEPVLNSSAEMPTYVSSAFLNAEGTFYDSGLYKCSAMVSSVCYQDYIRNSSTSTQSISVLFQYPRRPRLHTIDQVGENWIYVTWDRHLSDNISNYEVKHSYIGECPAVDRRITTRMISGDNLSYNITGLGGEYFNYSINITAINATGRGPPNIAYALTKSAAPSGAPRTFTSTLILSTNITVQWGRVRCRDRNSEISHYILRYFLADGSEGRQREVNVLGVGDSDRMYTVTRLHPASSYTLTIAAVNTNDQRGPNISINAPTAPPESVAIQLQLIGVHKCLQWRISDPVMQVYDVSEGIASGVNQYCPHCELETDDIRNGEFQCFPGSPNQVTFRGKVQDRAQATAREVISFIEQWITSTDVVTIPVHHTRLSINNTCVVLLASLDDLECPGYLTITTEPVLTTMIDKIDTSTQSSITFSTAVISPQSHSDAGAIVSGAVAIVLIITAGVVTVFLSHTILKHFQSTNSTPSAPPKGATTSNKNITDTEESNQVFVEMDDTSHRNRHYEPLSHQLPCDVAALDDVAASDDIQSTVHEENKGDENYYEM